MNDRLGSNSYPDTVDGRLVHSAELKAAAYAWKSLLL